MNAVILFSHGSVLCGGGKNLFQLARRLEARGLAPIVEVGFLNYSQPSFEEAFEKCLARGATRIIVAPYFLVAGYFVQVSLPPKIAAMKVKHPDVPVRVSEAILEDELLVDALVSCADRAQEPGRWRDTLEEAPLYCRNSPRCPLYDAVLCPKRAEEARRAGRREQDAPPQPLGEFLEPFELPETLQARAQTLQNAPIETALDELLRDRAFGVRFKTKQPLDGVTNGAVADFYAPEANLAIQIARDDHRNTLHGATARVVWLDQSEWKAAPVRVLKQIVRALNRESLLVMVHGSPRPESNEVMFAVVERLRARGAFDQIAVGFMECNEPDIPTALDQLAQNGARKIIAVPYFLHTGTHVADDLPTLLEEAGQKHRSVEFLMGDYLGHDPMMDEVIAKRVEEAK